jgi:hypothetical protein
MFVILWIALAATAAGIGSDSGAIWRFVGMLVAALSLGVVAVVLSLRFASMIVSSYFAVIRVFEKGSMSGKGRRHRIPELDRLVSETTPELSDLGCAIAVTICALILGGLAASIGGGAFALFSNGFPSLTDIEWSASSNPEMRVPVIDGNFLSVVTIAAIGLVATMLYFPIGFAMAGAYRVLNPLHVARAMVICAPAYLLILLYLGPFTMAAGVVAVLLVLLASPCLFVPILGSVFLNLLLSILQQYVELSRCAMMGLLLQRYRDRIFPERG